MILTCPACASRFMVDAAALGEDGRKVRCAKCHHQWFAVPEGAAQSYAEDDYDDADAEGGYPQEEEFYEENGYSDGVEDHLAGGGDFTEEEALAEPTEEMPDFSAVLPNSAVPLAVPPSGNALWIAAFVGLCLLATGLLLMQLRDSLGSADGVLAPLYRVVGYTAEDGVMLADVKLEELPSRRKKRYRLHCNIINTAESERVIPNLSMKIVNNNHDVLAEEKNILSLKKTRLDAGEHVECGNLSFESPFSSATAIILNLGSPLELSLRSTWDKSLAEAGGL